MKYLLLGVLVVISIPIVYGHDSLLLFYNIDITSPTVELVVKTTNVSLIQAFENQINLFELKVDNENCIYTAKVGSNYSYDCPRGDTIRVKDNIILPKKADIDFQRIYLFIVDGLTIAAGRDTREYTADFGHPKTSKLDNQTFDVSEEINLEIKLKNNPENNKSVKSIAQSKKAGNDQFLMVWMIVIIAFVFLGVALYIMSRDKQDEYEN